MKTNFKKWNLVWGIPAIFLFFVLLAIRLGLLDSDTPKSPIPTSPQMAKPAESWLNIYQNNQKIGTVHRKFYHLEKGGYQTEESIVMNIRTMGITQSLHVSTQSELNPNMSFSSFVFELNSSQFRFSARGYVGKDKLIVFSGLPHAQRKTIFPIKDFPHISGNIYEAAFMGGLAKNRSREFTIFDPSTMGIKAIAVNRDADEVIPIMGKRVLTHKFCADFMGTKNCAWLNKDGEILKETGLMGLSMEKVSPEKAQEGMPFSSSADLTEMASISSNRIIDHPSKLKKIDLKIEGMKHHYMLDGGRQTFRKNILSIVKENIPHAYGKNLAVPPAVRPYLLASALVQSDHVQLLEAASQIVSSADSPWTKAQKITVWVHQNIEKKPVLSVPNALEVLKNKMGDCNEHAVLTAALLRASGIPAQIEIGLVYLNGRFYYHAWNLVYLGEWITIDSVFNQIPADVTHIRLIRGEGSDQLDLLGVLGKIKLEVLSISYD